MLKHFTFSLLAIVVTLTCVQPAFPQNPPAFLIKKQATWKYHADRGKPPGDWNAVGFSDRGWKQGVAGFGYGDQDDRTLLHDMRGKHRAVFLRKEFIVQDVSQLARLFLYVNFDDGYIAYLNGRQVASSSVIVKDNRVRVSLHEAEGFELARIDHADEILKPGRNLLAIVGFNANIDSSDFSLDPVLTTREVADLDQLVDQQDVLQDLELFEQRLLAESSYLTLRGFDYESALTRLRDSIDEDVEFQQFADGLHRLVMQLGDCHASVDTGKRWPKTRYLPLRLASTKHGLAALNPTTLRPLDQACPYLVSIGGVPIEDWMKAASLYVPQGSPQLVRQRALSWLTRPDLLRPHLIPDKGEGNSNAWGSTIKVQLRSADNTAVSERTLRLGR